MKLIFCHEFIFYTSSMYKIYLHFHWLGFGTSIILNFGQCAPRCSLSSQRSLRHPESGKQKYKIRGWSYLQTPFLTKIQNRINTKSGKEILLLSKFFGHVSFPSKFLSSPIACVACERTELLKTEIPPHFFFFFLYLSS